MKNLKVLCLIIGIHIFSQNVFAAGLSPDQAASSRSSLADMSSKSVPDTFTTTTSSAAILLTSTMGAAHGDKISTQSLIDQAYAGTGDTVSALATASHKDLEFVCDAIVRLHKAGLISENDPAQAARLIDAALM